MARRKKEMKQAGRFGMLAGLVMLPLGLAASLAGVQAAAAGQAPAAAPLDLSGPLAFANGECRFSPAIDRAFPALLAWDERRQRFVTRTVRIGPMTLAPTLTAGPPAGGGRLYRASVRLTVPARWNGLTLAGLGAAAGYEYRQRELRFAEPAATVRRRLRTLGTALPAPPAYRRIPTDGCAASIGLEPRGRGSALVCTGWC